MDKLDSQFESLSHQAQCLIERLVQCSDAWKAAENGFDWSIEKMLQDYLSASRQYHHDLGQASLEHLGKTVEDLKELTLLELDLITDTVQSISTTRPSFDHDHAEENLRKATEDTDNAKIAIVESEMEQNDVETIEHTEPVTSALTMQHQSEQQKQIDDADTDPIFDEISLATSSSGPVQSSQNSPLVETDDTRSGSDDHQGTVFSDLIEEPGEHHQEDNVAGLESQDEKNPGEDESSDEDHAGILDSPDLVRNQESTKLADQKSDDEQTSSVVNRPVTRELSPFSTQELARSILDMPEDIEKTERINDLIWNLIDEGELALACQLARVRSENCADHHERLLPYWIIQLMLLSDRMGGSATRISSEIDTLLLNHQDQAKQIAAQPQAPEAILLRSGLMKVVMICQAPAAIRLLRSFPILESQTKLYNFCTRLASFASRSGDLRLEQYLNRPDPTSVKSSLRNLRMKVLSWRAEFLESSLSYRIVNPLFSRAYWSLRTSQVVQYPDRLNNWRLRQNLLNKVERLIRPILDDRFELRHEVQHQMDRLSQSVLLTDLGTQAKLSSDETVILPGRQLYNSVQEVIEFSSQWSLLATNHPDVQACYIPSEIEELKSEIIERQPGVHAELQSFTHVDIDDQLSAAAKFCQQRLSSLVEMFEVSHAFHDHQTDSRSLINRDLLRITGMTLKEDWSVNHSSQTLEFRILNGLAKGLANWSDAFRQQFETQNYQSASKIMTLEFWASQERSRMQQQLDQIRQSQVDAMKIAANRVIGQIEDLLQLNIIRQNESDAFRYQVKTLMAEGETLSQWTHARSELSQIQQLLEDRKQSELDKIKHRMAQLTGEETNSESQQTPLSSQPDKPPHEDPTLPESDDSSDQGWVFDL